MVVSLLSSVVVGLDGEYSVVLPVYGCPGVGDGDDVVKFLCWIDGDYDLTPLACLSLMSEQGLCSVLGLVCVLEVGVVLHYEVVDAPLEVLPIEG